MTQTKRFGVDPLIYDFDLRADANGSTLFLGGCHVGGEIVGEQSAFSALVQKAGEPLSNTNCTIVSGVSTRVGTRIVRDLIGRHRISRVILQLGHRETIRAARLSLPWRRRLIDGNDRSDFPIHKPLSVPLYIRKVLIGAVLYYLGFDRWSMPRASFERRLTRDLDELLNTLKAYGGVEVVLLSCFPTANKRLNDRRLVVNQLMSKAAKSVGFTYLDVWSALSFRSSLLRDFAYPGVLADSAHLNAKGHRVVAGAIRSVLSIHPPEPRHFPRNRAEVGKAVTAV